MLRHSFLLGLLALPLVGCMPTRPTPAPVDVEALTATLTAGHARAQAFLSEGQDALRIPLEVAQRTLADPHASAADQMAAARTVRAQGARLDQMILATTLQEQRVAGGIGDAQAACQDPRPYLRTGQPPTLAECGRMRLAFVQWQMDRAEVHAARDRLQQQRGDAEAAVGNRRVAIGPPTVYQPSIGRALQCVPASGRISAPAWDGAAL